MSTQDLKAAQLIPGYSNGLGRIERKNTHLLKLPHHSGSKESNRCPDSRDNGLERLARVGSVGQRWLGLFNVNAQFKGVEDLHLVPMFQWRLHRVDGCYRLWDFGKGWQFSS